jgi:hypothetical protein
MYQDQNIAIAQGHLDRIGQGVLPEINAGLSTEK